MAGITGRRSRPILHLLLAAMVLLWTLPTLGLFVTSFRAGDAVRVSGWWTALAPATQSGMVRIAGDDTASGAVRSGSVLRPDQSGARITAFGVSSRDPDAFAAGQTAELPLGGQLTLHADGRYRLVTPDPAASGQRVFFAATMPPAFTFQNYFHVLSSEGLVGSLVNSALVAVPSTLLPLTLATFAAYALAWMRFPGRALLAVATVALMAVPLQMALIPVLRFYNFAGQALGLDTKSFLGIWLAHTGFGLPLAIHLLRAGMSAVPREIIEAARLDGASELRILIGIVLPLSLPVLAAFAVFQFLWTWNDIMVALVFLAPQEVLTARLVNLMGSRGGEWEVLAASTFVSLAVPLVVFFLFQRHVVRGAVAGIST